MLWISLLLQADHSEKDSILNLISRLHNTIQKSYDTFAIRFTIQDSCLPAAVALSGRSVTAEELKAGEERLDKINKKSLK